MFVKSLNNSNDSANLSPFQLVLEGQQMKKS